VRELKRAMSFRGLRGLSNSVSPISRAAVSLKTNGPTFVPTFVVRQESLGKEEGMNEVTWSYYRKLWISDDGMKKAAYPSA
jgi:hypothetical protein